jgi:hypothetical protein
VEYLVARLCAAERGILCQLAGEPMILTCRSQWSRWSHGPCGGCCPPALSPLPVPLVTAGQYYRERPGRLCHARIRSARLPVRLPRSTWCRTTQQARAMCVAALNEIADRSAHRGRRRRRRGPRREVGGQVAAFVLPTSGQTPDPDELFAYCPEHLAPQLDGLQAAASPRLPHASPGDLRGLLRPGRPIRSLRSR